MKLCNVCQVKKPFSEFSKKGKGYQYLCKECRKIQFKKHYSENPIYYTDKRNLYRAQTKLWFSQYKTTLKCEVCEYNRCSDALDFHHLNPKEKDFTIAELISRRWKKEKVLKEIAKCIVLCANCHRELHYKEKLVGQKGFEPSLLD